MSKLDPDRNLDGLNFPVGARPAPGTVIEVAPGVLWLRMPLPIVGLEHINLWLLEDGDGWTIVDSGLNTPEIQAHWEEIFATALGGRPVTRLICTHFHPDHIGQAGWLTARWNIPLWMSFGEWTMGRMLYCDAEAVVPEDVVDFYHRQGFSTEILAGLRLRGWNNFRKRVTEIPHSFRRMSDGDLIRIGRHDWRVIIGQGHSPEHVSLYSASLGVLISGDQILPRISPHIGTYPTEPEANPLKLYLRSLTSFAELPAATLVLPSHNDPFIGLPKRLASLDAHHQHRLASLSAALERPATLVEVLPSMFKREMQGDTLFLAASEGLAHLHWLMHENRVVRRLGADNVYRFQLTSRAASAAE